MAAEAKWWVICDHHQIGPFTEERARKEARQIEALRDHAKYSRIACHDKHEVVFRR